MRKFFLAAVVILAIYLLIQGVRCYLELRKAEDAKHRFPNLTLATFPDGGHMMKGHGNEIDKALDDFINKFK